MQLKKLTHSEVEFSYDESLGEKIADQIRAIIDGAKAATAVNGVTSFAALYYALRSLSGAEIRDRANRALDSLRESYRLEHVEYAWLVRLLSPDLVHFDNIVCTTKVDDFAGLIKGTVENVLRHHAAGWVSADDYVECLSFFTYYNVDAAFDQSCRETRELAAKMTGVRDSLLDTLCIDLYNNNLQWSRIAPRESSDKLWSLPNCTDVAEIPLGESVISAEAIVRERLAKVLCGVDINDPGFPRRNVVFAGGLIAKVTSANYDYENAFISDVDGFIIGNDLPECAAAVKQLMEYFKEKFTDVWFAVNMSVCTVYILGVRRIFQIISNKFRSPMAVVANFDATHVQWFYYDDKFYCTPLAYAGARTRVTKMLNLRVYRQERVVKTFSSGYSILKEDRVLEVSNIDKIVEDPSIYKELLRKVYSGQYFPQLIGDTLTDRSRRIIESTIASLPKVHYLTADINPAMENFHVGGNFDTDYAGAFTQRWTPSEIIIGMFKIRRDSTGFLRNAKGELVLLSPDIVLREYECETADAKLRFSFVAPQEFIDFVKILENDFVKSIDADAQPDKRILKADNICELTMTPGVIRYKTSRDLMIAKNQHGIKLDPEVDIKVGDTIRFAFKIFYVRQKATCTIQPLILTKKTQYVDTGALRKGVVADDAPVTVEDCGGANGEAKLEYEDDVIV